MHKRMGCTEALIPFGYVLVVRPVPENGNLLSVRMPKGEILWESPIQRDPDGTIRPSFIELPQRTEPVL
jgi:hypothetical protein